MALGARMRKVTPPSVRSSGETKGPVDRGRAGGGVGGLVSCADVGCRTRQAAARDASTAIREERFMGRGRGCPGGGRDAMGGHLDEPPDVDCYAVFVWLTR